MSIYDRIDKNYQKIPFWQSYQSLNFESSRPCHAPGIQPRSGTCLISKSIIAKNYEEKHGVDIISAKTRFFTIFRHF